MISFSFRTSFSRDWTAFRKLPLHGEVAALEATEIARAKQNMKRFALIGAAGYIAPRHLRAIADTGNVLVAAVDRSDNVGILDSFFPDAQFFTEFERFSACLDDERTVGRPVDFVSIASPNYLHESHIAFALRHGADVICEKPLVLTTAAVDRLKTLERQTGRKVNTILQLRHHASLIALRRRIEEAVKVEPGRIFDVKLTYLTGRGSWYFESWKGDVEKSGGIAANIGIHFFDMLSWIFGPATRAETRLVSADTAEGVIHHRNARVTWFLSVNVINLPEQAKAAGKRTYRSITVDGEEIEFSEGFTELHTTSYDHILDGKGFGLSDARASIALTEAIRNGVGEAHLQSAS
jgi:UDP-N-acetyl-2-amino-2-deoxyglucuronate dehydrogenase